MMEGVHRARVVGWLAAAGFFLFDLFARLSVDVVEMELEREFNGRLAGFFFLSHTY